MTTLLSFVIAIALLVVFHEFGHYWVARRCGVKVLRFSVGFGKVIYRKRFSANDTEWVISAIPLGGYVKMLDEREGEVAAQDLPYAFNRKPVLQRMAIVVAGPLANLLLAIVLYWALFIHGLPGVKPILGEIPPDTPAAMAHMQTGETIVSINGTAIPSWQELRWALLAAVLQQGGEINVEGRSAQGGQLFHVLDGRAVTAKDLDGEFLDKLGLQLYQPPIFPLVDTVAEGSVAQRAGLQAGDEILYVNETAIEDWAQLVALIRMQANRTVRLEIGRGGSTFGVSLTPEGVEESGEVVGKIGVTPKIDRAAWQAMLTEVSYAPLPALFRATSKTWEVSVTSLKMLGKMVLGEVSMKNLSGPITIADYAGQSAQIGLSAYLGFLALISISLGILNLMPIPLLDGGHLLYYVAELVKGSPVSELYWEMGQKVGILLLGALMFFAIYNDINRLISG
ncbi:MAG: RIP metalloprotease RseP [Pseudomonadota bacterium]